MAFAAKQTALKLEKNMGKNPVQVLFRSAKYTSDYEIFVVGSLLRNSEAQEQLYIHHSRTIPHRQMTRLRSYLLHIQSTPMYLVRKQAPSYLLIGQTFTMQRTLEDRLVQAEALTVAKNTIKDLLPLYRALTYKDKERYTVLKDEATEESYGEWEIRL